MGVLITITVWLVATTQCQIYYILAIQCVYQMNFIQLFKLLIIFKLHVILLCVAYNVLIREHSPTLAGLKVTK